MSYIIWKPITGNYYAYLEECYYHRERKKSAVRGRYLGSSLEKAEAKLRAMVNDDAEYAKLVEELHRKRPEGKPPNKDIRKKAVKALEKFITRYEDNIVKEAINTAINIIKEDIDAKEKED